MKVQVPVSSAISDEQLQFIREIGINYAAVTFSYEDTNYDAVARLQERMAKYDITITDGGCNELFKCASIHLGKEDRDQAIDRYNDFTRVLGRAGIPIGFIAWQPNGIVRTRKGAGHHTRGAVSFIADMSEISARPIANGREYGEQEIWENFKYFLDKALPVCEEANVRIALHPNDPPAESLLGVHSLIYNSECYRRAFALTNNSAYLGMKLCVGCWLEGGEMFGNLMDDIKEFALQDKILSVHFRNVSSPMPYFEETLAEDGYADMYVIMQQLVHSGYKGVISVDHAFFNPDVMGGYLTSLGCFTTYMKGLLHAALAEKK